MTSAALSKDPADHLTCNPETCDLAPKAAKVHDLSDHTDPATERMRQETGHDCITCPSDVRNLMATAHNMLVRLDAARAGGGSWDKVWQKADDVRSTLARLQLVADQHFEALNGWRRP